MPSRKTFSDRRPRSSRIPISSLVPTVLAMLREHPVWVETRARRPESPSRTPVRAASAPHVGGSYPHTWVFPTVGSRWASRPWECASTHWRRHVRAGFGTVEEVLEVALQIDLVFGRGLSVHAYGSVFACPSMGCEHPFDVNVMCQGRGSHTRAVPGEFRDPLLFRVHGLGSRCTRHVSSQRFIRRRLLPSPGSLGWFPRLSGTMRRSDFLTVFSPHFVSFAWRYLGASAFRPRSATDAQPTDHPGVCCTGCSRSGLLQGTVRISQVPGEPL